MKYTTDTLKYIKSNPMLWVSYAIAAVCFAAIVDVGSLHGTIASYEDGIFNTSLGGWICLFLPINTHSWWTILLSLAAYVVLIFDLAFICAALNRHMRYNSLSPRGIFSSLNNELLPCMLTVTILVALNCLNALILAGVMMATSPSTVKYMYILGVLICAVLAVIEYYVISFFSLWLPCFNITGFRAYESFSYAYSLGATRRRPLFLSIFIPTLIIAACALPFAFIDLSALSLIIIALLCAALFVYIAALIYVVYLDADGITREDLKKF